jgi:hypothetical protein
LFPGQSIWDFWWTKWQWDRSFSKFLSFPCECHSTVAFHTQNNRPFGGRSSETTSHPIDINMNNRSTVAEQGSSGSIVSDYRLDDRAIRVRSPAGEKDFSSNLHVQTGSGAHPASCTMGTGGPFPRGKARPGRDADHSPQSSAEVKNE